MNIPLFIAKRYFYKGKKRNVINLLTWISISGVAVGTMALVIVLSVFNGFKGLIYSLYESFDPDIKITAITGKTFTLNQQKLKSIHELQNVINTIQVLEDNALVKYGEKQMVITVKGVESGYWKTSGIKKYLVGGVIFPKEKKDDFAVIGQGIQNTLGVNLYDQFNPLRFWYPKNLRTIQLNPEASFTKKSMFVSGVFSLERQFDDQYILLPLKFTQSLVGKNNSISALEVMVSGSEQEINRVKKEINNIMGKSYNIQDRFEQHKSLFAILNIEKIAIFFILSLILLIASFNIFSSLTMLVIDKKKDLSILLSMGADRSMLKKIFFYESIIISVTGASIGLVLGLIFCIIQQKFGLIKVGDVSLIIENYPVVMQWTDFAGVGIVIIIIAYLASLIPSRKAAEISICENLK